jgi:GNAT superfamily N-acetyltransferase
MKDSNYKIVPYKPEFKEAFKEINVEWLKDMFVVEDYDLAVLSDPQKYILDRKGMIYFAIKDNKPVGTCALMEIEPGYFELTKMAVLKSERGMGLGKKLLEFMLNKVFKSLDFKYFLLTNSDCKAAIHLYENFGFKHDQGILDRFGHSYDRANVGMIYQP